MWVLIITVLVQYQNTLDVHVASERRYDYYTNEYACKVAAADQRNNDALYISNPKIVAANWQSARCEKK